MNKSNGMNKSKNNRRSSSNSNTQSSKAVMKKRHKISDHFSRKDFYCPVNNNGFRISAGLIGALEELRNAIGQRLNIIKGFESIESAEQNRKVKRNFHTIGVAADIQVDNIPVEDVFFAAQKIESFRGLGINFKLNMIHVDTRKTTERICWVEENGNDIILTDENRAHYFPV